MATQKGSPSTGKTGKVPVKPATKPTTKAKGRVKPGPPADGRLKGNQ